jgi:release factor glutamine methyltransferase
MTTGKKATRAYVWGPRAVTPTPLELIQLSAAYLGGKGVPSPRLEAEVLLAHALGVPRIQLYLQFDKPLSAPEVDRFREYTRRRARREPTAYLTGVREFWSLSLQVDAGVLIPRPETEILVEACLRGRGEESCRLLDLGTGSGAVALALLSEREGWRAVGVDASARALGVACGNAERLGLAERFDGRRGDLFGPVPEEQFELIVSNPPYIPTGEIAALEPEVSRHEPREALDGGPDGLAVIRRIASEALAHLTPGGRLYLEFGAGQEGAVAEILRREGYAEVDLVPDYSGRPRVAAARHASSWNVPIAGPSGAKD